MSAGARPIVAAALLLCGASAAAATELLSPARQREILRAALHAFDQAVAVTREEPPRAGEL